MPNRGDDDRYSGPIALAVAAFLTDDHAAGVDALSSIAGERGVINSWKPDRPTILRMYNRD